MMRRIAVLLVVGLVVAACGGSDEIAVEGTAPTPSDVVELAAGAGELVSDETLSCLPMEPSGWWRSDVLVGKIDDARLAANDKVVVASGWGSGFVSSPAMHHSTDGLAWKQSGVASEMTLEPPPMVVAGGGKGFVYVGTTDSEDTEYGLSATPVVAFSSDGSRWEPVDPDALPSSRVRWFTGAFAGPEGFVIVGTACCDDRAYPLLVWFSDDGRTWSETDLPLLHASAAVAATDSGWAMVSVVDPFEEPHVQVWTSSDGRQWSEVDTDSPPPGHAVLAYTGTAPLVTEGDMWMLALTEAADDSPNHRTPTVWVSTDEGRTWEEVTVWDDPDQAGFQVFDLTATDHGFLLAGYQDHAGERGEYFVHHSEDGRAWQHCWTGQREFTSIEVLRDSVVVFDSGTPGQMFVWREP